MAGIKVRGGHLIPDLSVSPALVTFPVSEAIASSTVLHLFS